eukprot:861906-Pyramimonas_sp.AAC.1
MSASVVSLPLHSRVGVASVSHILWIVLVLSLGHVFRAQSVSTCAVNESFVEDVGLTPDGDHSISSPIFNDGMALSPTDQVIVVLIVDPVWGTFAKAYPLNIMRWHDLVNDVMPNGRQIAVSYDARTATPLVIDSGILNNQMGVTGLVYENNLVLYDKGSGSHWVQQLRCA